LVLDGVIAVDVLLVGMDKSQSGLLQLTIAVLILLFTAWATEEATQRIQRSRAERLLGDVRALNVDHSQWKDVQPMMQTWGRWSSSKTPCTEQSCNYHIDVEQTLPPFLVGDPARGRKWLPRFANLLGLRSSAVRAGFAMDRGVVTAKWFGEQVTLPVADWGLRTDYVPFLSVLAGESSMFKADANQHLLHPNRAVERANNYLIVSYTPDEEATEKARLMDFDFHCITAIKPCRSEFYILPEAWQMWQMEKK